MIDLDLEPPVKQRPIRVTTTATYLVWVDDDEDEGAAAVAARLNDDPCWLGDHIARESADDGDIRAEALDEWDVQYMHGQELGPWQVCPWPGCGTAQYPAYSIDPTCHRHRVTGCQHARLPERVFA